MASAVDGVAVVIGHLPAGLEPGKLGQFRSQRLNGNPNVSRPPGSRYATSEQAPQGLGNASDRLFRAVPYSAECPDGRAQIVLFFAT